MAGRLDAQEAKGPPGCRGRTSDVASISGGWLPVDDSSQSSRRRLAAFQRPLDRAGGDIPIGRLPGKKLPRVFRRMVSVEAQQTRRCIIDKRDFATIERLDSAANCFQNRFFASPSPQE